jgi:hypothetical protein
MYVIFVIHDNYFIFVDFQWDPSNIRPKSEELLDEMQTKELKNGRLAMTAIGGMLFQNLVTGQGLIEQLTGNNYL